MSGGHRRSAPSRGRPVRTLGLIVCGSLVVLAFIVMRADDSERPSLVAHLASAGVPNLRTQPHGSASQPALLLPLAKRPSFVCTPQQVNAQVEHFAARNGHQLWPTKCTSHGLPTTTPPPPSASRLSACNVATCRHSSP
jgi:hypothetical protein